MRAALREHLKTRALELGIKLCEWQKRAETNGPSIPWESQRGSLVLSSPVPSFPVYLYRLLALAFEVLTTAAQICSALLVFSRPSKAPILYKSQPDPGGLDNCR